MHVICGTPRSGSTLLCNILNQNPRFFASSTSALAVTLVQMKQWWGNSPEVKSDLAADKEPTEARHKAVMQAVCKDWYGNISEPVVFDKSRAWNIHNDLFTDLFPDGKMIVCVRDLREVFASVEKQEAKNSILTYAKPLVDDRADLVFQPDQMIGSAVNGVMDLVRKDRKNVLFVKHDNLVKDPKQTMKDIYAFLGEEYFEHDFEDVKNVATDLDALYLNKFPHEGCGKVEWRDPEVGRWVPQDIQQTIQQRYPRYQQKFGFV